MIFISRPKFTLNHWFLFLCFAHQAPTYLPLLCRCSLPSLAAWYTLYSDDAVILLLRIRPFCKPRGVLQSAPSKTMICMSTATCSFFHRNRKRGKGRRAPYIGPVFVTFLHWFREGKTSVRFIGIYSIYREVCYKCISKFHCGWYSSSQRWEKPYLCNQRVQLSLKSSCTKILDGSSRKQQWKISGNDETQWNVCHYYQRRPETWEGGEKVISKRKEIICLSSK